MSAEAPAPPMSEQQDSEEAKTGKKAKSRKQVAQQIDEIAGDLFTRAARLKEKEKQDKDEVVDRSVTVSKGLISGQKSVRVESPEGRVMEISQPRRKPLRKNRHHIGTTIDERGPGAAPAPDELGGRGVKEMYREEEKPDAHMERTLTTEHYGKESPALDRVAETASASDEVITDAAEKLAFARGHLASAEELQKQRGQV